MPSIFKLKSGIGASRDSDQKDVLTVQRALNRVGFFEPDPELGFNGFVDRRLDAGIRRFQKSRGLLVTGEVKAGDETEEAINNELRQMGRKQGQVDRAISIGGQKMSGNKASRVGAAGADESELITGRRNKGSDFGLVRAGFDSPAAEQRRTSILPFEDPGDTGDENEIRLAQSAVQRRQREGPKSTPHTPPANAVSPVPNPEIRSDRRGAGFFGADREGFDSEGNKKTHKGVDLLAAPGTPVVSPVEGEIRLGVVYDPNNPKNRHLRHFRSIRIELENGSTIRMFYVAPTVKGGDRVKAGQRIGTMQDRAAQTPRMKNHVHVQVHDPKGNVVDPAPWLKKWGVK